MDPNHGITGSQRLLKTRNHQAVSHYPCGRAFHISRKSQLLGYWDPKGFDLLGLLGSQSRDPCDNPNRGQVPLHICIYSWHASNTTQSSAPTGATLVTSHMCHSPSPTGPLHTHTNHCQHASAHQQPTLCHSNRPSVVSNVLSAITPKPHAHTLKPDIPCLQNPTKLCTASG
jgi:hypothetical protein